MKYIIIAAVIIGLIKVLADGAKNKQSEMPQYDSFPEIHYDKIVENGF